MKSPLFHLVVWLLVCGAVFAGYGVWYTTVTNKNVEVATLEQQILDKTQTTARTAAARTALAEIAGQEAMVRGYFVPETGVVPFIDDLQQRARVQASTMKVLSVSTGAASKGGDVLLLSIGIDGTFDSVMRTVGAVEYAPYDVLVSKFAIHKAEKTMWHADVELTVGSMPGTVTPPSP